MRSTATSSLSLIGEPESTPSTSGPVAPTIIYTFSRTVVQAPTPFPASNGDDFQLKVGNSGHRIADDLRTLALDRARPMLVQYADPFQALLFPGRAL